MENTEPNIKRFKLNKKAKIFIFISLCAILIVCFLFVFLKPNSRYLLNLDSDIAHYSTCRTIKKPRNYIKTDNLQEALKEGYRACKVCKPT